MTATTHTAHTLYAPRLLRRAEVERLTGQARSTIYDGIRSGTFPAPVRLSAASVAWVEAEVLAWIAAKIAERDAQAGAS